MPSLEVTVSDGNIISTLTSEQGWQYRLEISKERLDRKLLEAEKLVVTDTLAKKSDFHDAVCSFLVNDFSFCHLLEGLHTTTCSCTLSTLSQYKARKDK